MSAPTVETVMDEKPQNEERPAAAAGDGNPPEPEHHLTFRHVPPKRAEPRHTGPRKKIKLPPYKGLRPPSFNRQRVLPGRVITALTVVGFLTMAAVVADMYGFARKPRAQALAPRTPTELLLAVTTATNRYQDPQGRFSIALPRGWTAAYGGPDVEYDAKLEGPDRLFLQVIVAKAPGETLAHLRVTFSNIEQETARVTHIEDMDFAGRPAIGRYCRMDTVAFRAVDFLVGDTSFHLMGILPREHFATHRPVIDALMETIQPGPRTP